MVRGSSAIFKKLKGMAVLSAVLLSGIVMSGIPSISTPANGSPSVGGGTPEGSYADIGRPSFLVSGKYLNYSVNYGLVPGLTNQSTTRLTGNLRYLFNSVSGQNYSITEQTTNLNVSYGYTLPGPVMGFYNTGVANATLLAEQYRGYSGSGPIKASVSNSTDFGSAYSFTTTLDMYTTNGSLRRASGDGTNQVVVDSLLTLGSPGRGSYYGYYRTILSYYRSLSMLYRAPKALFTVVPGWAIDGTASIVTYLGTRSAVKVVHNVVNAPPVLNGTIIDLKWQDILYFDVYTGVLLKAVMYVDNKVNNTIALKFHQLEFNLVDSNMDFGAPTVSSPNTFEDAMYDVSRYLATSALNDTNRSLFYHAAIGGAATPSNSTKLSADTFKILFGYSTALETSLTTLFSEVNSSRLHDVESGGFYRSMDGTGTTVDGVKTVADAAWAIIASSGMGESARGIQQKLFDYMVKYHYGSGNYSGYTFYAFARYNKTSDAVFYAYDNLIAYLALNWLGFSTHNNNTMKSEAKDKATKIINLINGTNSFPGFSNGTLFVTSINKNGMFAGTEKSVLDAMLAIYALSTRYIYDQSVAAKTYVNRARNAFHKLLSSAWNATNKGFIHELDFNHNPIDANQYLEDNAWAMAASVALLEAANKALSPVKNITYYDVACDTWGAIKKVLYDSQNKTFKASSNNKVSLAGDLGVLLFSLSSMFTTSISTTLTVTTNSTTNQFVYENMMPVKAKAKWQLNMTHHLPSPLAAINTVIPLNYSDVYFKIRYSNQTIYDEIFTVTDNVGEGSFTFPIPTPPEFTDMDPAKKSQTAHLIGVVANRTGFQATEAFQEFYITSGIKVWTDPENPSARFEFSGGKFTAYFMNGTTSESVPSIYPGENFTVTIRMNNTIAKKQNVTITFEGDIIETNTTSVIVNESAVNANYTLHLTAKGDIPTGMQTMNFSISKNGSAIMEGEIPVYVNIPVVLTNVVYSAYMVDRSNYTMTFNVKNLNKNRNESVSLTFSSVNLVANVTSFNKTGIVPDQEIPVSITFKLKSDASKLNEYEFSIQLSWENVSLGTLVYLIPFRAPIEVVALSGPAKPVQGGLLLFSFSLRNNLASSASVKVTISRVLNTGATTVVSERSYDLVTGNNNFIVSCKDPLDNPWDIGAREYRIVVEHGGEKVGMETVASNVQMSVENVLLGYILVFGAFGIIFLLIFNKKRHLDSVRR